MYDYINKKSIDYIYILILSIPLLAVVSIFFLELALIIISISFLVNCYKTKNFQYFDNFFFKISAIFYLYILINFFMQSKIIDTLSIIFYFRYTLYTIAIYFFLDNKKKLFSDFLKVVFFLILFLGIDSIFQSIFKYNLIGYEIIEKNRASSFFGGELILGSFIFRMLPFIFLLSMMKKKIFNDFIISLIIGLSFLIIFLSGERTSMLLSFCLFLIYLYILRKEIIIKYLKTYFIILVVAFSTILFFSKNYQYRYLVQPLKDLSNNYIVTQHLLAGYEVEPKVIFFSGLHHNLMVTSLRIFDDNKIFGSGPRSYRNECVDYKINKYSCDTHPHNYYIQLLAETGLVGFSFLFFIYVILIRESYKIFKEKKPKFNLRICLLAFYIVALWPIIPSGNFFNNWLSVMMYLPFPFYLYLSKRLNN